MRMDIYLTQLRNIFVALLFAASAEAKVTTYDTANFCSFDLGIHSLDAGDIAYVEYSGEELKDSFRSCSIHFYGRSDDFDDEFKICVTAETFYVKDNALHLRYDTPLSLEDYSKNNPPPIRKCTERDGKFKISFRDDKSEFGIDRGTVVLKVESIKTYDNSVRVGVVVGAVIGTMVGLAIICTVVVGICYMRSRRRSRTPGRVINQPSIVAYHA